MPVWIIVTLAAALVQTARFLMQRHLRLGGMGTEGATFTRFVYAAPLALGVAGLAWAAQGGLAAAPPGAFWAWAAFGGLAQILATLATVALFALRNFAVGIVFTKTETVQIALFSVLLLGEAVPPAGLAAIALGLVGVILLSPPPEAPPGAGFRARYLTRAAALGLAAGALFGLSAVGYRAASLSLGEGQVFLRAAVTLAVVTLMQTAAMGLWLALRRPGAIASVLRAWRVGAAIGLTGMLGSLGWFIAFTLQNAALVRALGQVEVVFTLLASWLLLREKISRRELGGIVLVIVAATALVLAAG